MRGRCVVGNAIYHTVGDRESAVKQLKVDADRLYSEIATKIGVLPYAGSGERVKAHPVWFTWWKSSAVPVFDGFRDFYGEQTGDRTGPLPGYVGYGERFATDWDTYKQWWDRIDSVRKGAQLLGVLPPDEAPPAPLPQTVTEAVEHFVSDAGHEAKKAAEGIGEIVKIVAIGAIVVGGALAIFGIEEHAR